jgi:hypothetical protein
VSRFIDRGAVFAGYVGIGVALVLAITFELVWPIQPLVFLIAPLAGILVGAYANTRAERRRPWRRVVANSVYAGLVTGVGLAVLYASLRLLFVYADSGYRDPGQGGQLTCRTGPDCTYQRMLGAGSGPDLEAAGVHDAASFEGLVLREQAGGAMLLVVMTVGGAVIGAIYKGLAPPPRPPVGSRPRPSIRSPLKEPPGRG